MAQLPLLVTIPHSGEKVPQEADWLRSLPEEILMCDVDRYVDRLYSQVLSALKIPSVICPWHRYVVDLNRLASDVDADSVLGAASPSGTFPMGLHWVKTTTGQRLMPKPISQAEHESIVAKYFTPFHAEVAAVISRFRAQGASQIFHLDLHSMPSQGTSAHRDPGETRAEIVVSDYQGASSRPEFRDLVVAAYQKAGFQVALNWPYIGGRLTQQYGRPKMGQHTIQVELRRNLYMDEKTKQMTANAETTQEKLVRAVQTIHAELTKLTAAASV